MLYFTGAGRERDEIQPAYQRDSGFHLHGKRHLPALPALRNCASPADVHHERARARHTQPARLLPRALACNFPLAEHVPTKVRSLTISIKLKS